MEYLHIDLEIRVLISDPTITATALSPCKYIHLVVLDQNLVSCFQREACEAAKLGAFDGPASFGYSHSLQTRKISGSDQQASVAGHWLRPRSVHRQCSSSAYPARWCRVPSEHVDGVGGKQGREHKWVIETIKLGHRIGLFGTLRGVLIASKDYFKVALCTGTIVYPLRNLPLANSG